MKVGVLHEWERLKEAGPLRTPRTAGFVNV
jgi:hypothetical protein